MGLRYTIIIFLYLFSSIAGAKSQCHSYCSNDQRFQSTYSDEIHRIELFQRSVQDCIIRNLNQETCRSLPYRIGRFLRKQRNIYGGSLYPNLAKMVTDINYVIENESYPERACPVSANMPYETPGGRSTRFLPMDNHLEGKMVSTICFRDNVLVKAVQLFDLMKNYRLFALSEEFTNSSSDYERGKALALTPVPNIDPRIDALGCGYTSSVCQPRNLASVEELGGGAAEAMLGLGGKMSGVGFQPAVLPSGETGSTFDGFVEAAF